ncbi:MAG: (2Fe-2S)-binding protein [Bacillota bacterium]
MDDKIIVCRCEEVTSGEIKEAIKNGLLSPGEIRKFTRAGMGLCQGRTCRSLLMRIIKEQTRGQAGKDLKPDNIKSRPPVQPVSLSDLANINIEE